MHCDLITVVVLPAIDGDHLPETAQIWCGWEWCGWPEVTAGPKNELIEDDKEKKLEERDEKLEERDED
ncbi:hypothetical protein E3N88_25663 [Mikania micrantha]|uniref:Uncharacterized protein n=1 Tax=Mikania micrantha TaxID=192012 RepID=A0A5N6N5D5_9ASTR|nr:hypothetical protein E3N88_25663 [Mikania micrantha]